MNGLTVVILECLLVFEELLVILGINGGVAGLLGSVISNIHVLKELSLFKFLSLINVSCQLISMLLVLFVVIDTGDDSLLDLEDLETAAGSPLTVEGVELLLLEEGWSEELLTPVRSINVLGCVPRAQKVFIFKNLLVVAGTVEGPNLSLIKAMIDERHVGIRGVSVEGLTLHVVEVQFHIVILSWDHRRISNNCAFFGFEGLQALPIVILHEANIINIVMEIRVLLDALVEPLEGVIKVWLLNYTMYDGIESQLHTVVDLCVIILHLVVVDARLVVCAIETLVHAVHMDAPQVIDALVDLLVVSKFACKGWGQEPEQHVLQLQLEYSYTKI